MALIDDILDYSKIESGNLVMDNSLLDLASMKSRESRRSVSAKLYCYFYIDVCR